MLEIPPNGGHLQINASPKNHYFSNPGGSNLPTNATPRAVVMVTHDQKLALAYQALGLKVVGS